MARGVVGKVIKVLEAINIESLWWDCASEYYFDNFYTLHSHLLLNPSLVFILLLLPFHTSAMLQSKPRFFVNVGVHIVFIIWKFNIVPLWIVESAHGSKIKVECLERSGAEGRGGRVRRLGGKRNGELDLVAELCPARILDSTLHLQQSDNRN